MLGGKRVVEENSFEGGREGGRAPHTYLSC